MTKKELLSIFSFFLCICSCKAQKQIDSKSDSLITIGFYNVENLFDTIDSENTIDEAFLPSSDKKWNSSRYQDKLDKLADVITSLGHDNSSPEILGLAEVENKKVITDLINTKKLKGSKYKIVHYESPDHRGIDVALIYKSDVFKLNSSKAIPFYLPNDSSFRTRDLLLVNGTIDNQEVNICVAHWPSRRGGSQETNHKRVKAAKLARSVFDSLMNINPAVQFIIMGDFNDDPTNQSIKKTLRTVKNPKDISPFTLYNPMEKLHQKDSIGSLEWRGKWNLFDQIIISAKLVVDNDGLKFINAGIFNESFIRVPEGKYKGNPSRTYAGPRYLGGYSDHFPVYITLQKK